MRVGLCLYALVEPERSVGYDLEASLRQLAPGDDDAFLLWSAA
jgi:hypothetical protein